MIVDSAVFGSDHAGVKLKKFLIKRARKLDISSQDVGTDSEEPVDYPIYARKVVDEVLRSKGERKGVLICGTGIGMSIAANRYKGIRAALVHDQESAILSRTHNDANVLVLSGRTSQPMAVKIFSAWMSTQFSNSARHKRRIEQLDAK